MLNEDGAAEPQAGQREGSRDGRSMREVSGAHRHQGPFSVAVQPRFEDDEQHWEHADYSESVKKTDAKIMTEWVDFFGKWKEHYLQPAQEPTRCQFSFELTNATGPLPVRLEPARSFILHFQHVRGVGINSLKFTHVPFLNRHAAYVEGTHELKRYRKAIRQALAVVERTKSAEETEDESELHPMLYADVKNGINSIPNFIWGKAQTAALFLVLVYSGQRSISISKLKIRDLFVWRASGVDGFRSISIRILRRKGRKKRGPHFVTVRGYTSEEAYLRPKADRKGPPCAALDPVLWLHRMIMNRYVEYPDGINSRAFCDERENLKKDERLLFGLTVNQIAYRCKTFFTEAGYPSDLLTPHSARRGLPANKIMSANLTHRELGLLEAEAQNELERKREFEDFSESDEGLVEGAGGEGEGEEEIDEPPRSALESVEARLVQIVERLERAQGRLGERVVLQSIMEYVAIVGDWEKFDSRIMMLYVKQATRRIFIASADMDEKVVDAELCKPGAFHRLEKEPEPLGERYRDATCRSELQNALSDIFSVEFAKCDEVQMKLVPRGSYCRANAFRGYLAELMNGSDELRSIELSFARGERQDSRHVLSKKFEALFPETDDGDYSGALRLCVALFKRYASAACERVLERYSTDDDVDYMSGQQLAGGRRTRRYFTGEEDLCLARLILANGKGKVWWMALKRRARELNWLSGRTPRQLNGRAMTLLNNEKSAYYGAGSVYQVAQKIVEESEEREGVTFERLEKIQKSKIRRVKGAPSNRATSDSDEDSLTEQSETEVSSVASELYSDEASETASRGARRIKKRARERSEDDIEDEANVDDADELGPPQEADSGPQLGSSMDDAPECDEPLGQRIARVQSKDCAQRRALRMEPHTDSKRARVGSDSNGEAKQPATENEFTDLTVPEHLPEREAPSLLVEENNVRNLVAAYCKAKKKEKSTQSTLIKILKRNSAQNMNKNERKCRKAFEEWIAEQKL